MSTSRSHEVFDTAAIYRHKFEGLFDMHGVKTGSPEDLRELAARLETDRYFAMDFREMAQSAARLGGGGSTAEICEMVVRCVGGPAAQDTDPGVEELRKEFAVNGASRIKALDVPESNFSESSPSEGQADEPQQPDRPAENGAGVSEGAPRLSLVTGPDEVPSTVAAEEDGPPAYTVGAGGAEEEVRSRPAYNRSQQLDDALSRLEINNNALKLHLDTIDHRVSRIEPHLEDLTSQVASTSGRGTGEGPTSMGAEHPGLGDRTAKISGRGQPEAVEGSARASVAGAALRTARARRQRRLVKLTLVLLAALCVWALTWTVLRRSRGPAVQDAGLSAAGGAPVEGGRTAAANNVTEGAAGHTNRLKPQAMPSDTSAKAGMSSDSRTAESAGTIGVNGPAAQTQAQTQSQANEERNEGARSENAAKVEGSSAATAMEERAVGENSRTAPATGGSAAGVQARRSAAENRTKALRHPGRQTGRAAGWGISVSSGVMASNLISSVPANYPKLAKLAHIQGVVVMQVFVSKDGTVDHINAVKGHHLLRGAAESAVRQWRYRPYLLNGHAVEVATVVTVDFKLGK